MASHAPLHLDGARRRIYVNHGPIAASPVPDRS